MPTDVIIAEDLECMYRENYSRYYYLALHFVNDVELAKDIINEVFLAVWKNHHQISKSKLRSYVFMSIRNKCLTYVSHKKPLSYVDELSFSSIPASEEEWEQKEERILEMEKVVESMNPRTRYVLEQFYYQHRSYKEIAGELGITTDGVKKQLVKALTLLKAHFNINKHKSYYQFLTFLVSLI